TRSRVERRRDEEGDPVRAHPGPPAGGLRPAVRRSGACGDPEGGSQVHDDDHDQEEALLLEEALLEAQADAGGGGPQAVGLPGSGRGSPLMARRVIPPARHFYSGSRRAAASCYSLRLMRTPRDVPSYAHPDRVRVRHADLDLDIRFDRRILEGS